MVRLPKRAAVLVPLAYITYVVSVILQTSLWAAIAAPAFDFLAAGLIFHAVFTSKNKLFKVNFILVGIAVLFWAFADLLWLIYEQFLHIDPGTSDLITVLYFGTNVFLVAATIYFVYNRLRKWDSVQLILDGVSFSLAFLWLLWELLYDKQMTGFGLIENNTILNSISIGTDIFILVIIGIWYLSIRKGGIPFFVRILVSALSLYAIIDLVYYYQYAKDLYLPDTLTDIIYLTSLFGLAVSVKVFYVKYADVYKSHDQNTNIGSRHKGLYLVLGPMLILVLTGLDVYDIGFYLFLILIHEYVSMIIQRSIDNKMRLYQELEINKKLETLVSVKTQDIKSVNDELRQKNLELNYTNLHDSLTGLYNRTYFQQKLEEEMSTVSSGDKIVLMVWNIDKLKEINDTYGHATGDQILLHHAHRVQKALGNEHTLVRLGGDEFAYLLRTRYGKAECQNIAEKIVETCKQPFLIDDYTFHITIGVGIASFPYSADDIVSLLKHADVAMHYVKETKRENRIAWYLDISEAIQRKRLIGNCLKKAVYNRDLDLNFQPIFSISDRNLIGMEALLRWNCPEIGAVSPAEFIPIAEQENLIIPIGNWVIETAVRQIVKWNTAYHTQLRIGINFSPKQFDQESSFAILDAAIKQYQAAYEWIDIEITEGIALDFENSADKIKNHLTKKGVSISIDDFGTGYSSMGYLSILSFDSLKIAKELIDKITFDEPSRKIVVSIIMLAKSLRLKTLAEGVETKEQFDLLLEHGCDQIQGYYLGKPASAEEFENKYLKMASQG